MSVTRVMSDMRSSVITWNVSLALILIAMSHEKSSKALDIGNTLCVLTNKLDEPVDVPIDHGLGAVLEKNPGPSL